MAYTVYMLTLPNKKKYVGMTSRKLDDRWKSGNGYAQNKNFYSDIKKSGWKNVKKEVLFETESRAEAKKVELEFIVENKSYKNEYGYNHTSGLSGRHCEDKKVVYLEVYEEDKYLLERLAETSKVSIREIIESILIDLKYKHNENYVNIREKRHEELLGYERKYQSTKHILDFVTSYIKGQKYKFEDD